MTRMIRTKGLHKSYSFILRLRGMKVCERIGPLSFSGFWRHLAACTAIHAHIEGMRPKPRNPFHHAGTLACGHRHQGASDLSRCCEHSFSHSGVLSKLQWRQSQGNLYRLVHPNLYKHLGLIWVKSPIQLIELFGEFLRKDGTSRLTRRQTLKLILSVRCLVLWHLLDVRRQYTAQLSPSKGLSVQRPR